MQGTGNESHTPITASPRDQAADDARRRSHVAVVHSPRGVLLLSVAASAAARDRDVADYVRRQAARQLAPGTRDRVLTLLDAGAVPAAVSVYFDAVGEEWDTEWLHLAQVPRPAAVARRHTRRREVRGRSS